MNQQMNEQMNQHDRQRKTVPTRRLTRREYELELAGPFFAILCIMTIIAFLIPLRPETSMRERRTLKEFPTFRVDAVLSGEYFDDITAWFSDTFPGRETMLDISDGLKSLHGISQNEVVLNQGTATNDNADLDMLLEQAEAEAASRTDEKDVQAAPTPEPSYAPADPNAVIETWEGLKGEDEADMYGDLVVIDGTALSKLGFDQNASDHHVALVNAAGNALAQKGIRFFNLPAPTSISVLLSSDMLSQLGSADQGKTLRYMFALENDNVYKVNAFNNMLAHNSEYIYFNTDHHWTALGAYYAYEEFCATAGFDAVPLSEYQEWNMGEFTGTFYYSVNNNKNLNKDEMIAWVPPGNDRISMEIAGYPNYNSVIVDESESDRGMKYNCFIAGDNPITVITNDNLPDAPDCLVIKDSYGNPFVVYLTQHYHKIYVLDYRKNFTPVSTVASQYGVQDVILVQSIGVSQTRQAQYLLDNLMK